MKNSRKCEEKNDHNVLEEKYSNLNKILFFVKFLLKNIFIALKGVGSFSAGFTKSNLSKK